MNLSSAIFRQPSRNNPNKGRPGYYSDVHFRIDKNGYNGQGWSDTKIVDGKYVSEAKTRFYHEVRSLLEAQGWTFHNSERDWACDIITKGKSSLYLQSGRQLVKAIVDELAKDERISQLYDSWYEQRENVIGTYTDTFPKRVALAQNKEFKAIKNSVISEAASLIDNGELIIDNDVENSYNYPLSIVNSQLKDHYPLSTINCQLLCAVAKLFEEKFEKDFAKDEKLDSKLRREIAQKKQAQGQKLG